MKDKILQYLAKRWEYRKKYLAFKKKKDKEMLKYKQPMSMTKKLMIFLFSSCLFIEVYTGIISWENMQLAYAMGLTPDFTPLTTLIGAIVGEVIGFAIYSLKSLKENSAGGIVYDSAMKEQNKSDEESEEGEG